MRMRKRSTLRVGFVGAGNAQKESHDASRRVGDYSGVSYSVFDDLVAEAVFGEVRPADAPVGVVFEHRFGHLQLERPALEPLLAEEEREVAHPL